MNQQSTTLSWWAANRTKLAGASCLSLAAYLAYRSYTKQNSTLSRLSEATKKYCEAYETSAELFALVTSDLKAYLTSDQSDTPQSIRQLAKLLQAEEVQQTVQRFVASAVTAVQGDGESSSTLADVADKVIQGLLSEQGRSLVGLAVAKAAQHGTEAVCGFVGQRLDAAAAASSSEPSGSSLAQCISAMVSEDGERLLRVVVGEGMSRAVTAYMAAATPDNYYEDMLGSLSHPEHSQAVKEILSAVSGTFARELVSGFMQASSGSAAEAGPSTPAPFTPGAEGQSSGSDTEEDLHDSVKSLTPKFARAKLAGADPQWLTTVSQLSRQPDVQALAVEMTKTSVREAMGSVLRPFYLQFGVGGEESARLVLGSWLQRMYTMASVMLSLMLYMCSR